MLLLLPLGRVLDLDEQHQAHFASLIYTHSIDELVASLTGTYSQDSIVTAQE
jgi:hypothetical protein